MKLIKKMQKLFQNRKILITELIFSVCYFFRQSLALFIESGKEILGGNADIFYFGGVITLYQNRKNLKKLAPAFSVIILLLTYSVIQIAFLHNISVLKLIINLIKMSLCILLTHFVYDNLKKVNIYNILIGITLLNFAFTLIAIFFKTSIVFWTQNDFVNKYDLSRLKLFYLEPSELGFHLLIVIIFLLGFYIVCTEKKYKNQIIVLLIINILVLYFSKPLGSIAFGGLAIFTLLLYDWIKNNTEQKTRAYIVIFLLLFLTVFYVIYSKNSVYLRVVDTFQGKDASNWYRIKVAFSVMLQSFIDTKGIGIGFGNLRTTTLFDKYSYLGLHTSLANSYPSFIVEGGIFAIVFILVLNFILIRACIRSHSSIKWSLLVFLITYQIFGGYFTSTLYWILYGVILGDFTENNINKQVVR